MFGRRFSKSQRVTSPLSVNALPEVSVRQLTRNPFSLAQQYEEGKGSVPKDLISAYVLYAQAARQGATEAAWRLKVLDCAMPAEQWQEAQQILRGIELTHPGDVKG